MDYEFLSPAFLSAMNDIGRYGNEKYKDQSFHARRKQGDCSRGGLKRNKPQVIADHAREHFNQYLSYEAHDHFGTDKHQLAAVAFNAMMEFYYAGLEDAQVEPSTRQSEAVSG
jgi:hypothetical protein